MTSENPYLIIDTTRAGAAQTIGLSGEADLSSAAEIEAAFRDASVGDVGFILVDLSRLTFIDSSGLQALITGHELCRSHGHELGIVPGPENVQRLFELTGMSTTLRFASASVSRHDAPRRAETQSPI